LRRHQRSLGKWRRPPLLIEVENIALASYRVQISRIRRVGLDLLPQAVDLHVDGPLVLIFAKLGQILAADRLATAQRKLAEHLALLVREADRIVAAPE